MTSFQASLTPPYSGGPRGLAIAAEASTSERLADQRGAGLDPVILQHLNRVTAADFERSVTCIKHRYYVVHLGLPSGVHSLEDMPKRVLLPLQPDQLGAVEVQPVLLPFEVHLRVRHLSEAVDLIDVGVLCRRTALTLPGVLPRVVEPEKGDAGSLESPTGVAI